MAPLKRLLKAGHSGSKALGLGLVVSLAMASGCQTRKTGEGVAPVGEAAPQGQVEPTPAGVAPAEELKKADGVQGTQGSAASQDSATGLTMQTSPTAQTAEPVVPAPVVKAAPAPTPECVTVTFRHHATAKHALGEECVLHGNRIELPESLRDPKFASFCVRVDGVAVRAKREKNSFMLAAARKPTSVITVQGCPKDKACAQDCTPARDAFLEGLVGDAGEGAGAGWKGEADAVAALDPTVKRELAALDDEAVSSAWDSGTEAPVVSACAPRVAKRAK